MIKYNHMRWCCVDVGHWHQTCLQLEVSVLHMLNVEWFLFGLSTWKWV